MPTATIDVDTEVYLSAGDLFLQVNDATCDVVSALATAVGSGGGMAGTDSGGVDWAKGYDEAAAASLTAGATLADALGRVGDLLTASGGNHAGADSASTPGGPPSYPGSADPTASRAVAVLPATPPSANGTDDDPPAGWFLVAHLLQYVWPNGHQDRLRAVADGWTTASAALSDEADRLSRAIGDVSMLRSPEVEAAVTTCCDVQRSARDLSANYATLGTACSDYADHLDEAHAAVTDELVEFAIESAAIQTASALAAAVTFGAAEVAGQVAQAARTALAATRIGRILQKLLDVVRTVTATIRAVATRIADVLRTVKGVVAKGATKALERIGVTTGKVATGDIRKFSEYVLSPTKNRGKLAVFQKYGYSAKDAEELMGIYTRQAAAKYRAGDYTMGRLDEFGQRVTIEIVLPGKGAARGTTGIIKSGWLVNPDSTIRMTTPFAG